MVGVADGLSVGSEDCGAGVDFVGVSAPAAVVSDVSDSSAVFDVFDVSDMPAVLLSAEGLAHATPGLVTTATPMPSATANAPIRPMCREYWPVGT
ncbi:hypothetical protein MARA_07470 [Mycolicibacterium arabiense]|uniref:Uncharacterized protein n=1 Tax=Mycolicibacterium arabiense TaxID=1286181 RepID=A0A7I7RTL6_9MYCO|nr:hypothetical protein MARA_07470 [Mycolicibacterium arabiense]